MYGTQIIMGDWGRSSAACAGTAREPGCAVDARSVAPIDVDDDINEVACIFKRSSSSAEAADRPQRNVCCLRSARRKTCAGRRKKCQYAQSARPVCLWAYPSVGAGTDVAGTTCHGYAFADFEGRRTPAFSVRHRRVDDRAGAPHAAACRHGIVECAEPRGRQRSRCADASATSCQ